MRTPSLTGVGICLGLAVVVPSTTQAQIPFIGTIFGKARYFNAYFTWGSVKSGSGFDADGSPLMGVGVEVAFDVYTHSTTKGCSELADVKARKACVKRDTTRTLREIRLIGEGGPRDTVYIYDAEFDSTDVQTTDWLVIDAGVGYGLITGYSGAVGAFRYTGSIQELPYLAGYVSLLKPKHVHPYVGARAGLVGLHNFRARLTATDSTDQVLTGGGATFMMGGVGGLVLAFGPVEVFFEAQWTHRKLRALEWGSGGSQIFNGAPTELDVGGVTFAVGLQVGLPGS